METEWIILCVLTFLAAGSIKGVVGIGLPTASLSILSQFSDPHTALVMVAFPMCLSNLWQLYRSGQVVETALRLWPFAACLSVGVFITSHYTADIPTDLLLSVIGVTIMVFSAFSLIFKPIPVAARFDRPMQMVCGSIGGVMGGLTTLWSPPMVIYLLGRGVKKDDFVRATGFLIFVGSVPLIVGFWKNGMLSGALSLYSAAMIIPTVMGFTMGEWIRRRIAAKTFQKLVLILFFALGANIVRKIYWG